jgi:hypothetical protein
VEKGDNIPDDAVNSRGKIVFDAFPVNDMTLGIY